MQNKPLGPFVTSPTFNKESLKRKCSTSKSDSKTNTIKRNKKSIPTREFDPKAFEKFSGKRPTDVPIPSVGRTLLHAAPPSSITQLGLPHLVKEESKKLIFDKTSGEFRLGIPLARQTEPATKYAPTPLSTFNLGLPDLKSPDEPKIPDFWADDRLSSEEKPKESYKEFAAIDDMHKQYSHGTYDLLYAGAELEELDDDLNASNDMHDIHDLRADDLLDGNQLPPHTPPHTPIGTPEGTPTRLLVKASEKTSSGAFKECILNKQTNIWTKNPFPNFQYDPSKLAHFRNTPYEMFREQREGDILSAFFNNICSEENNPRIKIKTQEITDEFIFEQENLSEEISNSQKTEAIKHIFKHLPDLWREGYLLLPDAKFDNIGAKSTNDTLTIYLFDWHFESADYSDIFDQTYSHILWLINHEQITRDDAINIFIGLIDALNTPNLSEILLNKKQFEDTHYNPSTFFERHKKGIKLHSYPEKNRQFRLDSRPSLLNHQAEPKKLIKNGLDCLKRYLNDLSS